MAEAVKPDLLLTLEGVHTHIGQYHILQGVDLALPRGGMTVLLGRNGAGKTTTLRTIMGLWKPSKGTVTYDGRSIGGMPTPDIAQRGIAYVPETMAVFADLTVAENMTCWRRGPVPSTPPASTGSSRSSRRSRSSGSFRPGCSPAGRSRCWRSPAPLPSRAPSS
jgi:ABC-type branched-subunit amino acid transport system ATPase component